MVLGIKVATAEGKLIKSGGRVVKNVAGYDLCKLLVGSFGTLGVIVEASFKLFPRPAARATWALEAGSLGLARDIRRRILNSPLEPLRLALFNGAALDLLGSDPASTNAPRLELWVEAGGAESILPRYARDLAEIGRSMGVPCRPLDAQTAAAAWARLGDYERLFAGSFPEILLLKAALPLASSEEFLSFAQQLAEGNATQMAAFAQVGVGIVHLGLWGQGIAALTERLVTAMRKAAAGLGGALLVEGYPRGFEAERDAWGQPGDSLEAMRRLKSAWDPRGVLSPGRFVGGI
jgi:glycolate oxidase FAD binding subunit